MKVNAVEKMLRSSFIFIVYGLHIYHLCRLLLRLCCACVQDTRAAHPERLAFILAFESEETRGGSLHDVRKLLAKVQASQT